MPSDSASSAVRNLHDYEIMGRKLRVDFSNERPTHGGGDDSYQASSSDMPSHSASNGSYNASSTLPPLPAGKDLPAGVTCTDAISRTLNTLPPSQLLDTLREMKALCTSDPGRAAELLQQAPQMSYAVFQALLLMGLISPEAIHSVLDPNTAGGAAMAPPAQAPPPVAAPTAFPPQMQNFPQGVQGGTPVGGTPYAAPPPAMPQYGAPPPAMPGAVPGMDPEGLMRKVMELPQAMVDQLPEAERNQILALRNSFMSQRR